jgi:hypothetical protein
MAGGLRDDISWTAGGAEYSARAAYTLQFSSQPRTEFRNLIWKTWATGQVKFFCWLLHQNRLWCNDRLQRRGWENAYFCQLCNRNLETSVHLFWECRVAREVWQRAATWSGCAALNPTGWPMPSSTTEVVAMIANKTEPGNRRGILSLTALISWRIWLERNCCTFKGKQPSVRDIIGATRSDMEQWRLAGAACIETPFEDPT